ncbi:MAG: hypothetical protein GZ089_03665 [Aromatoleum sp.]|nr:hypothetical protein [Aromatoleum sp.]
MRRKGPLPLFAHPMAVWSGLAWKTAEMLMASAQVIGHRTGRLPAAEVQPNGRDRREFALMGQEKMNATTESAQGMATQLTAMNLQFGLRSFQHLMTLSAALMSFASSRSAGQSIARHTRLVRAMTDSAATASTISASALRLAHDGLGPIHARATANARRLAQKR